jgi:hypothetical protein
VLKVTAPYISSPLNYICNKSIKYSIVKPLFKKGDTENMANYRPIYVLTSFSTVFEKTIYMKEFCNILKVNNILVEEQSRFSPATSKDKAFSRLINEILNAMNEGKVAEGIFYDLQKEFDCVNHNTCRVDSKK